jgi:peptidylprolyl isomerase
MLRMMEQDRPKAFTPEAIEAYTTIGGSPHLDGSYTVFGQVLEGFDVIDRIAAESCDSNNRPMEDIVYHVSLVK